MDVNELKISKNPTKFMSKIPMVSSAWAGSISFFLHQRPGLDWNFSTGVLQNQRIA